MSINTEVLTLNARNTRLTINRMIRLPDGHGSMEDKVSSPRPF